MSRLNTEGRIVVKHRSGRPKRLAPKTMSDIRAKLKRGTTSLRGLQKIMQAKGVFVSYSTIRRATKQGAQPLACKKPILKPLLTARHKALRL